MRKRGQITIFIIVGLLIIGAIIMFLVVKGKIGIAPSDKVNLEVELIDSVIEECVKQRAIDAIRIIGLQGGYVIFPENENYLKTNFSDIAYGHYNGKKTLASKKQIEKEIAYYVKITLPFCIDEDNFPNLNITQKQASASSKIKQDFVFISAKLPVTVSKEKSSFTINRDYEAEIPIRLGKIYDALDEIINKQISEPGYIDLTYLTSLEYNVVMIPFDEDTIIYSITDSEFEIDEIPYSFMFASKF